MVVGPEADALTAAAYLHDIGYAPELATTGSTRWTELGS
jgi:HD superfamily phosphodiesterase